MAVDTLNMIASIPLFDGDFALRAVFDIVFFFPLVEGFDIFFDSGLVGGARHAFVGCDVAGCADGGEAGGAGEECAGCGGAVDGGAVLEIGGWVWMYIVKEDSRNFSKADSISLSVKMWVQDTEAPRQRRGSEPLLPAEEHCAAKQALQ